MQMKLSKNCNVIFTPSLLLVVLYLFVYVKNNEFIEVFIKFQRIMVSTGLSLITP